MTRCHVCAAPLDHAGPAAICARRACRWKAAAQWIRARRQQQLAAVVRSARRMLAHAAARSGVRRPSPIPIAVLPANLAEVAPLPARRRAAFRAHLLEQIGEAAKRERRRNPSTAGSDSAAPPPPIAAGCAACRGRCCNRGGEHAFVDFTTIRRYTAQTGVRAAPAIVQAYLRYVPRRSYRDSCVYHTAAGCNLPRAMRGDVCNQFYCGAIREQWQTLTREPTTIIAAAEGSQVIRLRTIDH